MKPWSVVTSPVPRSSIVLLAMTIVLVLAGGAFSQPRAWLRERGCRHGTLRPPGQLLPRSAGSDLDPEPYLQYLQTKFA